MIDLKTIHYIKAIAEEGSFQKAAASLYIAKTVNVSLHLREKFFFKRDLIYCHSLTR